MKTQKEIKQQNVDVCGCNATTENVFLLVVIPRLAVCGGSCWCYKKAWTSLSCATLLSLSKEWSCRCVSACALGPMTEATASTPGGPPMRKKHFLEHSMGQKNNLPREKWLNSHNPTQWSWEEKFKRTARFPVRRLTVACDTFKLSRQNMTAFKNLTPLTQQWHLINKFAVCVLRLFCIGRNKFIFHASTALWLLLIENTEWFPTSLSCTQTTSAAEM